MSQVYAPFGLRPAYSQSGIIRPGPVALIASAYATALYQGNPIQVGASIAAAGLMVTVAPGVAGAPPLAAQYRWNGVFSGVEYTDTLGRRNYPNQWVPSTVLPTNADCRAYYTADSPDLIYEIQCNAALSLANPVAARAAIGRQYGFTALAGNSVAGLAATGLDVAAIAAATEAQQLRIVGLRTGPDNDWGDPYPIVLVMNAAHPWVASGGCRLTNLKEDYYNGNSNA